MFTGNVSTKMEIKLDQDDEDKIQCYKCGYKSHRGLHENEEDRDEWEEGSEEEKEFLGEPLSASLMFALMKEYPCR